MPQLPKPNNLSIPSKEWRRLCKLVIYEQEARQQGFRLIAGIDEAGRGPLAGPVVCAACIIPDKTYFDGIDDSKKLTAEEREILYEQITTREGVIYGLGIVSSTEIDRINIFQATIVGMLQAIAGLSIVPDYLLVDGLKLPHPQIPSRKIIKGDAKSQSIAAASILAKVTRDRLMEEMDTYWPLYGFKQHKGYATPQHIKAIENHGPCPIHRMSFDPLKNLLADSKQLLLPL